MGVFDRLKKQKWQHEDYEIRIEGLKEIDSDLYASISFAGTSLNFSNIGLWSYYPDRGNWNRE